MDFAPTDEMEAVRDVAGRIFASSADPWTDLAAAELLDLPDWLAATALLVEVGRAAATVPVLATLALGWPLRRTAGEVVTGGLVEEESPDPRRPRTTASNGRLYGVKSFVPAVERATRMALPASDGIYEVDLADCRVERQLGTDGQVSGRVVLEGAPGRRIGGTELLEPWLERVHLGIAALQLGLAQRALELTAEHVKTREQFDRKIGTFQAVQHRAADAWIDLQAMEVALWQAGWRIQSELPAAREVAIARFWASEGSHRVLTAAHHLHGGMGFDRDHALHRYFLASKQWEFFLGGSRAQLALLGRLVAGARHHGE